MIELIAVIGITILLPVAVGKIKRTRKAYIPVSPNQGRSSRTR